MYSRYIPNQSGGYDRRLVPDPPAPAAPPPGPPKRPSPPPGPPPGRPSPSPEPPGRPPTPPASPPQRPISAPVGPPPGRPPPSPRPPFGNPPMGGGFHPRPPGRGGPGLPGGPFAPGGLLGANGALSRLLSRLETEDFLILAVLLLAMKQDGASALEMLLAAAFYSLL